MKKKTNKPLIVGVTGGIGSGKTEVCKMLQSLGATVISSDRLARELMETNGSLRKKLLHAFGDEVYLGGGVVDRVRLSEIVFSDEKRTREINEVVHPYVLQELRHIIRREKASGNAPILVIEAALIFESGADRLMDYVVVVDAEESTRVARVKQRDGLSAQDILRRQRMQMTTKEKVARADFVIHNDGDISALEGRIRFLHGIFRMIAASRRGE